MTHNSSVNSKVIPFLVWPKDPIKVPILTLWWKFAKFSCLISNHYSVFLQNLHNSSVSCKITHLYLCSWSNIFFGHKDPIKTFFFFFFWLLKCSDQNFPNFLCQFWNNKSIPLQVLHPSSVSWKITPLYLFSSNNIYFAQKEPI